MTTATKLYRLSAISDFCFIWLKINFLKLKNNMLFTHFLFLTCGQINKMRTKVHIQSHWKVGFSFAVVQGC